jgi:hypothetical protein
MSGDNVVQRQRPSAVRPDPPTRAGKHMEWGSEIIRVPTPG